MSDAAPPAWVKSAPGLSAAHKFMLGVLWGYGPYARDDLWIGDDDDRRPREPARCWESCEELARLTGEKQSTVRSQLRKLRDSGWFERGPGSMRVLAWRSPGVFAYGAGVTHVPQGVTGVPGDSSPPRGDSCTPRGEVCTPKGSTYVPQTLLERSKEHSTNSTEARALTAQIGPDPQAAKGLDPNPEHADPSPAPDQRHAPTPAPRPSTAKPDQLTLTGQVATGPVDPATQARQLHAQLRAEALSTHAAWVADRPKTKRIPGKLPGPTTAAGKKLDRAIRARIKSDGLPKCLAVLRWRGADWLAKPAQLEWSISSVWVEDNFARVSGWVDSGVEPGTIGQRTNGNRRHSVSGYGVHKEFDLC